MEEGYRVKDENEGKAVGFAAAGALNEKRDSGRLGEQHAEVWGRETLKHDHLAQAPRQQHHPVEGDDISLLLGIPAFLHIFFLVSQIGLSYRQDVMMIVISALQQLSSTHRCSDITQYTICAA